MAAYNSSTDLVLADDLFLYVTSGDTVLAFATSVSLDISADEIDASSKMSGAWKANLAGKSGYSLSSDALFTQTPDHYSFDQLMQHMITREKLDWKIGHASDDSTFALDTTKPYYSGTGFITSLNLNGGNNEVASCSVSITGNGAIAYNAGAGE